VYSSTFTDPENLPTERDILGALCLIIYTLTLIPLIKYVIIVLRANDKGNGKILSLCFFFPFIRKINPT
jgi:KUP system potassium uptake protein